MTKELEEPLSHRQTMHTSLSSSFITSYHFAKMVKLALLKLVEKKSLPLLRMLIQLMVLLVLTPQDLPELYL